MVLLAGLLACTDEVPSVWSLTTHAIASKTNLRQPSLMISQASYITLYLSSRCVLFARKLVNLGCFVADITIDIVSNLQLQ